MFRIGLVLTAAVLLASCDEVLPPGDWTSVDYWADYFLNKYDDELIVGELEPGPEPLAERRPVLLVTGVTIRAEWFDPIVARLQRDGFDPIVYEPPELLSYDLFEATEDLAEVVEQVLEDTGQERIDILAECTGGVIARHYVQSLGGDETVSRMVTFVSPQHGVGKAPLAWSIAGWPALDDLSPGSEFLTAVNEAPLPQDIPFTSIYTCTDEYIRPIETSIIPGANNIELCDGFIGHFQTFYDPAIYLIMYEALTEPTIFDEARVEEEPVDETPTEETPTEETPTEETPTEEPVFDDIPPDDSVEEPEVVSLVPTGDADSTPEPDIDELEGEPGQVMACNSGGQPIGSGPIVAALMLLVWLARRRRPQATPS